MIRQLNSKTAWSSLGTEIYNKLSFEQHIFTLCNKTGNQLSAIGRIQKYMGFKEKEVLPNRLYSNFNYCPLVWHFCSSKSFKKSKKYKSGH